MGCTSSIILPNGVIDISQSESKCANVLCRQVTSNGRRIKKRDGNSSTHSNGHGTNNDGFNEHNEEISLIPRVYLNHVINLDKEKRRIKDIMDTFVLNPDNFEVTAMMPSKGILLHGPSGCGKALLAEAFASKYALNFLKIRVVELAEEEAVNDLIQQVVKAVPSLLLLKHLDQVFDVDNKKEIKRGLDKLLQHTLYAKIEIYVFGTARKKENVDSSLLKENCFSNLIHIQKPHKDARKIKWKAMLRGSSAPGGTTYNMDFDKAADLTSGFTHTDLEEIWSIAHKKIENNNNNEHQTHILINKDHLTKSINEYCDLTRGNSMIDTPD